MLGAGFGDDLGSALSDAFDKAFKDPVGDLIGYHRQGPCNGTVFVGVERFSGTDLDNLVLGPLTYTLYPGTPYPLNTFSPYPGIRFTRTHTDADSHDTEICGHIAETDVTFSIVRLPFISVRTWTGVRFPNAVLSAGLRRLRPQGTSFGVKSLLGSNRDARISRRVSHATGPQALS